MNLNEQDRLKSLEELDNIKWEPPGSSRLTTTIQRLMRMPIKDYSAEDLRIMIRQDIGIHYLLPVALERLWVNPLASGDLYTGDLLSAVMNIGDDFWQANPDLHYQTWMLVDHVKQILDRFTNDLAVFSAS